MGHNTHLLLLLLLSIITLHFLATPTTAKGKITAVYAFGDSTLDSGNNNGLTTICKSNHEPYGALFPGKIASGRFSDGLLASDFLVSQLGIKKFLSPYLDPTVTTNDLLTGATFASACSGLDDLTATTAHVLSMPEQFKNFERAVKRMEGKVGLAKAAAAVKNAVFLVSAGSSDMLNNYYLLPLRRIQYKLPAYHDLLIKNLDAFIQELKNAGAKRMVVVGMPPLGCLPMDVTKINLNSSRGNLFRRDCKDEHNSDAQQYNTKLQALVKKISSPSIKIAYMDIYTPLMNMIKTPKTYKMKKTLEGCCGSGVFEMGPLCSRLDRPCEKPSEYVFWDAAHPTQAAYAVLTKLLKTKVLKLLN